MIKKIANLKLLQLANKGILLISSQKLLNKKFNSGWKIERISITKCLKNILSTKISQNKIN